MIRLKGFNMERLYLISSFVLVVMVMSQWTIATILMILMLTTPMTMFGSYLIYATYTRRNLLGSSSFIVPFVLGVLLCIVSIKLLSVIYQII